MLRHCPRPELDRPLESSARSFPVRLGGLGVEPLRCTSRRLPGDSGRCDGEKDSDYDPPRAMARLEAAARALSQLALAPGAGEQRGQIERERPRRALRSPLECGGNNLRPVVTLPPSLDHAGVDIHDPVFRYAPMI